jgi:hypothetical protein
MSYFESLGKKRRLSPLHQEFVAAAIGFFVVLCGMSSAAQERNVNSGQEPISFIGDATRPIKSFDPDVALATAVGILPQGMVDKIYTPTTLKELSFLSFEHYPFPPCDITRSDLYREPELGTQRWPIFLLRCGWIEVRALGA